MSERIARTSLTTWLRARSRGYAVLALLAVALQMVGTFGHVHLDDPFGAALVKSSAVSARVGTAVSAFNTVTNATAAERPQHTPASDGDVVCPLCLTAHLVASAVVSAPPILTLPVAYAVAITTVDLQLPDARDYHASFWSRGPPTS